MHLIRMQKETLDLKNKKKDKEKQPKIDFLKFIIS